MSATPPEGRPRGARKVWRFAIRLLIGGGAIAILIARTDVSALGEVFGRVAFASVLLAVGLMLAVLVVSAYRWAIFLHRLDLRLRPSTLQRMYFVGTFFNAFLPTGVGGDAYKAMRLRGAGARLSDAFASVLLDRIAAVVALALVGGVAAAMLFVQEGPVALVLATALSSLAVIVIAVFVLVSGDRWLRPRTETSEGMRARLWRAARSMRQAASSPRAVRDALALGILAQVLTVAAHASLADALDLRVGLPILAAGVTLATLLTALPLSINGVGIREAGWVWVLETQGVTSEQATGYAFLVLGIYLASSAVGGLVYLLRGGSIPEAAPTP